MFKEGTGWRRAKLPMKNSQLTFLWLSLRLLHITPHFHLQQFPDSAEHIEQLRVGKAEDKSRDGKQFVCCATRGSMKDTQVTARKGGIAPAFATVQHVVPEGTLPQVLPRACALS